MDSLDFLECEGCACFSARKMARLLTQHYDKYLRRVGLRAPQYTVLVMLIRVGQPVPLNRVADFLGLERTTLTRNLETLEEKGYIRNEPGQDRRVRLITITDEGRAAAERAFPYWKQAQDAVAEHVSPEVLKMLASSASSVLK